MASGELFCAARACLMSFLSATGAFFRFPGMARPVQIKVLITSVSRASARKEGRLALRPVPSKVSDPIFLFKISKKCRKFRTLSQSRNFRLRAWASRISTFGSLSTAAGKSRAS